MEPGCRGVMDLHSQLAAADTVLPADVLDAIDEIVAPGVDLAPGSTERFQAVPKDSRIVSTRSLAASRAMSGWVVS